MSKHSQSRGTKQILGGAAAAVALGVAGFSSSANADLVRFDLRALSNADQGTAGGFGGTVSADGKSITPTATTGDLVIEIWAMVANNDGNINNDGFIQGHFSLLSGNGGFLTDLAFGQVAKGFTFAGSGTGKTQTLDADADLDIGSNVTASANPSDFFIPISGTDPQFAASKNSKTGLIQAGNSNLDPGKFGPETVGTQNYVSFKIGQFDITWNHAITGGTTLQIRPRVSTTGTQAEQNNIKFVTDGANGPLGANALTELAGNSTNISFGAPIAIGAPPAGQTITLLNSPGNDPLKADVTVTGSNGNYNSSVANFAVPAVTGGVDILGFPNPLTDKPLQVLLDLSGFANAAALDAFLATLAKGAGDISTNALTFSTDHSGDTALFTKVASEFAGAGRTWDVLVTYSAFPNPADANSLDFTFDFTGSAATVNNIAVVPEPGTLSLLGLGALGLLGRRRRHA